MREYCHRAIKLSRRAPERHLFLANSFCRHDYREVQRPLGVVQPVCRLGPPRQSRRGGQDRRRARASQGVVPPRRYERIRNGTACSWVQHNFESPGRAETNLISHTSNHLHTLIKYSAVINLLQITVLFFGLVYTSACDADSVISYSSGLMKNSKKYSK